ncbi:hypothetical protein KSF78_0002240 [Schistosoma japonicum]|nr:hypothetical protein KSF78_0002240 [Schistosoma japonicum]
MRMVCQIALLLSVVMIVSFDASVSGEYNLTKDDVGPFLLGVAMGESSSDESSPVETRGSKKKKKNKKNGNKSSNDLKEKNKANTATFPRTTYSS